MRSLRVWQCLGIVFAVSLLVFLRQSAEAGDSMPLHVILKSWPFQIDNTTKLCCQVRKWRGLMPTLRILIADLLDVATSVPSDLKDFFQFCHQVNVTVAMHLRTAICMATFPKSKQPSRSFNASFRIMVYKLGGLTQSILPAVYPKFVYVCKAGVITLDSPKQFRLEWKIANVTDDITTHATQSSTPLNYNVDSERGLLPAYSALGQLDINITNPALKNIGAVRCFWRHSFASGVRSLMAYFSAEDIFFSTLKPVVDAPPAPATPTPTPTPSSNTTAADATTPTTSGEDYVSINGSDIGRSRDEESDAADEIVGWVLGGVGMVCLTLSTMFWAKEVERRRRGGAK